eukprot:TsM_000003300 transcript=TsM_000003300 gene=TsM_000003300
MHAFWHFRVLSQSNISEIEDGTFEGFENLQYLWVTIVVFPTQKVKPTHKVFEFKREIQIVPSSIQLYYA